MKKQTDKTWEERMADAAATFEARYETRYDVSMSRRDYAAAIQAARRM